MISSAARNGEPAEGPAIVTSGETDGHTPLRGAALIARRLALPTLAIFALALAARLIGITRESLWVDEACGVQVAEGSLAELLSRIRTAGDVHGPVYYLLLDVWIALAGRSDLALRLPSAVLGSFAVLVAAALAARIAPRAAIWAGVFAALSPVLVAESQDARMSSLFTLELSLALLLAARTGRSARVALGVVVAAAVLTHASGLMYALAFAAATGLATGGPRRWPRLLPFAAGIAAAFPIAVLASRHESLPLLLSWNRTQGIAIPLMRLAPYLLLGDGGRGLLLRVAQVGALLGALFLLGVLVHLRALLRSTGSLVMAMVIPVVIAASLSIAGARFFLPRFFACLALPLATLLGSGVSLLPRLGPAARAAGRIATLLLLGSFACAIVSQWRAIRHPDIRRAVLFLDRQLHEDETLFHYASEARAQESFIVARCYRPQWDHCLLIPRGEGVSASFTGFVAGACRTSGFAEAARRLAPGRTRMMVMITGLALPGEDPSRAPSVEALRRDLPNGWRIGRQRSFHLVRIIEVVAEKDSPWPP